MNTEGEHNAQRTHRDTASTVHKTTTLCERRRFASARYKRERTHRPQATGSTSQEQQQQEQQQQRRHRRLRHCERRAQANGAAAGRRLEKEQARASVRLEALSLSLRCVLEEHRRRARRCCWLSLLLLPTIAAQKLQFIRRQWSPERQARGRQPPGGGASSQRRTPHKHTHSGARLLLAPFGPTRPPACLPACLPPAASPFSYLPQTRAPLARSLALSPVRLTLALEHCMRATVCFSRYKYTILCPTKFSPIYSTILSTSATINHRKPSNVTNTTTKSQPTQPQQVEKSSPLWRRLSLV